MRLYLLRHAKSSWDHPELDDHDRPLAPRGGRAAKAMAETLAREGIHLDAILTSSALRARETARRVLAPLGPEPEVVPDLYMAAPGEIFALLRGLPTGVERVAVVGHNPGMQTFALRVSGGGPSTLQDRLRDKFPTGALAEIDLPVGDWSGVGPGSGTLLRFLRPKDLTVARAFRL
ncbi:MAG: histidine phosphatase family protein [Longimicrobiales bacterium]|nr:histidine phosphatase family protein [Longimicrobiales bacterium]